MTLLGSVLKLNLKTAIESAFLINDSVSNRIVPQLAENPYYFIINHSVYNLN